MKLGSRDPATSYPAPSCIGGPVTLASKIIAKEAYEMGKNIDPSFA